jgi:hypothetical protein
VAPRLIEQQGEEEGIAFLGKASPAAESRERPEQSDGSLTRPTIVARRAFPSLALAYAGTLARFVLSPCLQ